MTVTDKITIFTTKVKVPPECMAAFSDWQAKLNTAIAKSPGFVSLEILSSLEKEMPTWTLVQRFHDPRDVVAWRASPDRLKLLEELKGLLGKEGQGFIQEMETESSNLQGGVTEVFVTQIALEQEEAYREWIAKIHRVEATFPGFRGMYVQSPKTSNGRCWITLLQFDTPENLDRWLSSSERQEVLKESTSLISSFESHRIISPYAGWFSSIAKDGVPAVWKQTMVVLLVLFPVVMFELKYLSPWTANLNLSLGTFIGNAISVSLLAWPLMPLAIWLLSWWLIPSSKHNLGVTLGGFLLMMGLYAAEIALLWHLL